MTEGRTGFLKYSPDQPRDSRGRWADGGVALGSVRYHLSPGAVPGSEQSYMDRSADIRSRVAAAMNARHQITVAAPEVASWAPAAARAAGIEGVNRATMGWFNTDDPSVVNHVLGFSDNDALTLAHEVGHYLDYNELGLGISFSSAQLRPRDSMQGLRRAMRESPSYARWGLDPYLTSEHEMFARAYAQWLNSDASLAEGLVPDTIENFDPIAHDGSYWPDDEFGPIGEAMDVVFAEAGLLHSTVQKYSPSQPRDRRGRWTSGGALQTAIGSSPDPHSPALDSIRDALFRVSGGEKRSKGSPAQRVSDLRQPDGGFTYDVSTGEFVDGGFAVSPFPEAGDRFDISTMTDRQVEERLLAFEASHAGLLARPGSRFGAWTDPSGDRLTYLDVSIATDSAAEARRIGAEHGELAFWDGQMFESVDIADRVAKYAPGQPRDERGRWTDGATMDTEYRGIHTAPMNDGETPNLGRAANGETSYPADLLTLPISTAVRYYGMGDPDYEADEAVAVETIRRASRAAESGRVGGYTRVYRAVPKAVKGGLNPGDWVTPSRRYAKDHGEGNLGGVDYRIIAESVPLDHLYTDGNSLLEWGYDPRGEVAKYSPSQPRDNRGRWTSGGASGIRTSATQWSGWSAVGADQYGSDEVYEQIAAVQGFDALPEEVTAERFLQLVDGGAVELHRGIAGDAQGSGIERTDQFRYGKLFGGRGAAGSGSYFSTSENEARAYAMADGDTIYAVLKPGSKVTTLGMAKREMSADFSASLANGTLDRASSEIESGIFHNVGTYAAAVGYDAIEVGNSGHYVVLNRGALVTMAPKWKGTLNAYRDVMTPESVRAGKYADALGVGDHQDYAIRARYAELGIPLPATVQKYSPSQPRDGHGRWTSGSFGLTFSSGSGDFGSAKIADRMDDIAPENLLSRGSRQLDAGDTIADAARDLADNWNRASNSGISLDLQDAAERVFRTPHGTPSMMRGIQRDTPPLVGDRRAVLDTYVRATYAVTQDHLRSIGVKGELTLYRGKRRPLQPDYEERPLTSWTTDRAVAEGWVGPGGHLLTTKARVEDIWSVGGHGPGLPELKEVILLGREGHGTSVDRLIEKYDPSQPRDYRGRWTDGITSALGIRATDAFGEPIDPRLLSGLSSIPEVHRKPEGFEDVWINWSRTFSGENTMAPDTMGTFAPNGRRGLIHMNPDGLAPGTPDADARLRAFATHEYGHALDNFLGHGNGKFASTSSMRPRAHGVVDAMRSSSAYKRLGGSAYYTSSPELFARGYAQWVATRAGDTETLDWMHDRWDQWTAEEFEPIAEKYDALFGDSVVQKYSPSQPRDERGRWTSSGGGSRKMTLHMELMGEDVNTFYAENAIGPVGDAIEKTHANPDGLDEITVRLMGGEDMVAMMGDTGIAGLYSPMEPGVLWMNADHPGLGSTMVHEFAHLLDNEYLNATGPDKTATGKASKLFEAMRSVDSTFKIDGADVPEDRKQMFREYLDIETEMFARGYAQWVAHRSGDPVLLQQISSEEGEGHWRESEFEPIAKAYDEFFADAGLSVRSEELVAKYSPVRTRHRL